MFVLQNFYDLQLRLNILNVSTPAQLVFTVLLASCSNKAQHELKTHMETSWKSNNISKQCGANFSNSIQVAHALLPEDSFASPS